MPKRSRYGGRTRRRVRRRTTVSRRRRPVRRRTYKRKSYKVRRSRIPGTTRMFPSVKLVQMRFCDTSNNVVVATGATPIVSKSWSANNMFSPNLVGGTNPHQPAYHDTWMKLYSNYTIVGAKIVVKIRWANNALNQPLMIGFRTRGPNNQALNSNSYARLCEQDPKYFTGWKSLEPNMTNAGTGPPDAHLARPIRKLTLTGRYSRRKSLHIPKKDGLLHQSEIPFGTSTTGMTDPENPPFYFDLMTCAPFGNVSGIIDVETKIEYIVAMQNPILVTLQ